MNSSCQPVIYFTDWMREGVFEWVGSDSLFDFSSQDSWSIIPLKGLLEPFVSFILRRSDKTPPFPRFLTISLLLELKKKTEKKKKGGGVLVKRKRKREQV